MKKIFHNGRELRAGWRLLLFCILVFAIGWAARAGLERLPLEGFRGLHPVVFILEDTLLLAVALIATLIMARFEGRSFATYGIPGIRELFGRKFWIGAVWGFVMPAAVILLIFLGRGYHVSGLNVTGAALLKCAALWLVATLFIGFGALHYFTKPFERWEDWVAVTLITIFITLALRRTGSLAFPIGMHAAFDFAFIY